MENNNREWVEKYIDKELSPQEKQQFEERVKTDNALAEELSFQLEAIAILRAAEKAELKAEMNTWWGEVPDSSLTSSYSSLKVEPTSPTTTTKINPPNRNKYLALAAAAAILLLLFVAYLQFSPYDHTQSPENLIAHHLSEPHPISADSGERNIDASTDSLRNSAEKAYKAHNFAESIRLFAQVVQTPEATFLDDLYLGLSHLYLPQQTDFSKAVIHLEKASKTKSPFVQIAEWYLALSLYKNEKEAKSKEILQKIANQKDGDYADRAKELLKKWKDK